MRLVFGLLIISVWVVGCTKEKKEDCRLTSIQGSLSGPIAYEYDAQGRMTKLTS